MMFPIFNIALDCPCNLYWLHYPLKNCWPTSPIQGNGHILIPWVDVYSMPKAIALLLTELLCVDASSNLLDPNSLLFSIICKNDKTCTKVSNCFFLSSAVNSGKHFCCTVLTAETKHRKNVLLWSVCIFLHHFFSI